MKLPDGARWRPIHEVFDWETAAAFEIQVTDEVLPAKRAIELFTAARSARQSGWSAIILAEESLEYLAVVTDRAELAQREATLERTNVGELLGERTAQGAKYEAEVRAVLDVVAKATGLDPISVLPLIDAGELDALAEGELDPEVLADVQAQLADPEALDEKRAYEAMRDARNLAIADARATGFGGMMVVEPLRTHDVASAIAELSPGAARVAVIHADAARALMLLGYGGFNDCPSAVEHAAVWRHWAHTLGAEPAVIRGPNLDGVATKPVRTREDLIRFAREVACYDLDVIAQADGWLPFLAGAIRNASLGFWWD